MSFWDDPDLKVGGDFIKFDQPGDEVCGRITGMRAHRFDDGSTAAQLFLDVDGEERTLTAGQVRLKAALAEQRPEVGDVITVKLTQLEQRAGGRTLKHFDVAIVRGNDPTPSPAAPPAAAAAAPAGLTAEQQAALKAAGL